jgi:hypothetical protein
MKNANENLPKSFIYSGIILGILISSIFLPKLMLTDTKNTLQGKRLAIEFCNLFYNNTPTSAVDNHQKLMLLMTPEFLKHYKEVFDNKTYSNITASRFKSNYEYKRFYKKMINNTMTIKVLGIITYASTKNNKITDPTDITTTLSFVKDKYGDLKIDNMETMYEIKSIEGKLIEDNRKIVKEEGFEEISDRI